MVMERLPNPKGDRVKITMSGKFLAYKYYGARGNVPEFGFKEGDGAEGMLPSRARDYETGPESKSARSPC
jgi:hypothetical protein